MRKKSRLWLRWRWRLADSRDLRGGFGYWNPNHCHFPSRSAAVSGGLSVDWLWLRLLPALSGVEEEYL